MANVIGRKKGFTLIELMVTVAIVGILASIATSSYSKYVTRSKRAEAFGAVLQAAQAMERLRSRSFSYASALAGTTFSTRVPSDGSGTQTYTLSLTNHTASTYTILAVPMGAQASDGNISLTHTGQKIWANSNCWPDGGNSC